MPSLTVLEQRGGRGKVVTFPAVWGDGVVGQVGDVVYTLVVDGQEVSRRYRAERTGYVQTADGMTVTRAVAGSGGHATKKAHRRHGYDSHLDRAFLQAATADGFELAMLFCLEPLVEHNRRLGWTMTHGVERFVTYLQPNRPAVSCPDHIWVGLQALTPTITLDDITAIHVEGLPW